MRRLALFASLIAVWLAACSSTQNPPAAPPPTPLPPLTSAPTTLDRTLLPARARQDPSAGPNPALPDSLATYLAQGFGETTIGPGEPTLTRTLDGTSPPAPGPNAKKLVRFVHMPDLQLMDDESPTRLGSFDNATFTTAALRPQDAFICRMVNASVRTINALHANEPLGFVLMGGDNADSAQTNEIDWVMQILSGAPDVACDSGDRNDVTPGPNNDGKDPFFADGLKMPWKWVTGNHDVLVQGTLHIDDRLRQIALGTVASSGTRDYTLPGGPVQKGDFVVPDARRALLSRAELMAKVASNGDGHGLGDVQKESGKAIYAFDAPGTPIRFVVIDTAAETGGAEGIVHQADVDRAIKPALDAARAEGKWVVLASHHSVANLTTDGGPLGAAQADALTSDAYASFVGGYPNVVFSIVGHSHQNRVLPIAPAGGHAWWEVMTSSLADFPHQFRLIEVFDQDNGWLMLRGTCVDFSTDGDAVAAEGRRRGTADFTAGWGPATGRGAAPDRNVELWIKKP